MNGNVREPDGFEYDGAPYWEAGEGLPLGHPRTVVRDGEIYFIEIPFPIKTQKNAQDVADAVLSAAAFLQRDGEL